MDRPSIFKYHDYKMFLKDWLAYLKVSQPSFSLRNIARESKLSPGLVSMIFSGDRPLTVKAASALSLPLQLSASESSYLKHLSILANSENASERQSALEKLQRFDGYKQGNQKELEAYKYLKKWYYVAIREMTAIHGFEWNAKWIQERLGPKLTLQEVKSAMDFLIEQKIVTIDKDNKVLKPDKTITAIDGVYKISLAAFHKEMLGLASEAIFKVERDRRHITAQTISVPRESVADIHKILDETSKKIHELTKNFNGGDDVYHVSFLSFPLTLYKKETLL